MIDLSTAQAASRIETLLDTAESQTLEFKRVSGKMVGKALATICAFANTDGRVLALGIGDPASASGKARLYGIEENPEALDELSRKTATQFNPALGRLHWLRLLCALHDGKPGYIVLLRVEKSEAVHSIVDDGTWMRMGISNREMTAAEIAELHYRRDVRSAAGETVPVALQMLETDVWRRFIAARGLRTGTFTEQLQRIGLAIMTGSEVQPTRAAVLLFAEEPGSPCWPRMIRGLTFG